MPTRNRQTNFIRSQLRYGSGESMVENALHDTYASRGAASGCASGRTRSIASFSNQTTNAIFHARSAPLMEYGSVMANNTNKPKIMGSSNPVRRDSLGSTGKLEVLLSAED